MNMISVIYTKVGEANYANPAASCYYSLRYEALRYRYKRLMCKVNLNQPEKLIPRTNINNLDPIIMLKTQVYNLDFYRSSHSTVLPAYHIEYHSKLKKNEAVDTIHAQVCELLPEWKDRFDAVKPKGEQE